MNEAPAALAREWIEVEEVISDGGGALAYYVRGRCDHQRFIDWLLDEYNVEAKPAWVADLYMRFIPDVSGEFGMLIRTSTQPGRGAFPVTYFDLDGQQIELARKRRAAAEKAQR